jgi:hypothetical protein
MKKKNFNAAQAKFGGENIHHVGARLDCPQLFQCT